MRKLHEHERRHHRTSERVVSRAMHFASAATLVALTLVAGCGDNGRAMHPDASSLFTCTTNAQCDDHIACTVDNCDVSGTCQHTGVDSMCTAPARCVVGTGCSTTMTCTDASMCDDAISCTLDTCNVGNVCGHQPINSMCSAPTPVCDATRGCIAGTPPGCTSAANCDDSIACTVDSCGADMMCHHMTVDSLCMSGQTCSASAGCMVHHACTTVADCMNPAFWNLCDGTPICATDFGCMPGTPRVCDDGNHCTTDTCDRTAGTNGACTTACDHTQTDCGADPACATTGPTCTGTFAVSPIIAKNCAAGMVNYNFSTVSFDIVAGQLIVTPGSTATFGSLSDTMAPVCPSFDAEASVIPAGGGVSEYYSLVGDFTDDNHFTATWTEHYVGFGHAVCAERTLSISGTRM